MKSDSIPDCVESVFRDFPHVHSVVWDGEVKVNGSVTGPPEIFEQLWDYFVDSPHVSFHLEGGVVVRVG